MATNKQIQPRTVERLAQSQVVTTQILLQNAKHLAMSSCLQDWIGIVDRFFIFQSSSPRSFRARSSKSVI